MKKLALHNWHEPDVPRSFPGLTEEVWLSAALEPKLTDAVPEEVVRLFEVARGSILYGWFFYPLLTLASEQLHRVQEAAVRARSKAVGISLTKQVNGRTATVNFQTLISELHGRGIIRDEELEAWHATRKLRNWSSHPAAQSILPPGMALSAIDVTARHINQLFAPNPDYFSILGERVRSRIGLDDAQREHAKVVGIDVGDTAKGFHLVALHGAKLVAAEAITDPLKAAQWCHDVGATLVGVDAPCGWSRSGAKRREAEDLLGQWGYATHATPSRERASQIPFYRWMLNGERLYAALQQHFPLYRDVGAKPPFCFETYPYLAACGYAARRLKAAHKKIDRRNLIKAAGIDDAPLTNIDFVDAAICAMVALSVSIDYGTAAGNPEEGYILYPPLV
jgi:predicted nuclease with RNAse H fold